MIRAYLIFFVLIIVSCENPYEVQNEYLLPSNTELRSIENLGITTYRTFSFQEQIILDSLSFYPLNKLDKEEKEVMQWHLPTEREWDDLNSFFNYEERDTAIIQKVKNWYNSQNLMVAYIYDREKNPIGTTGYEVTDWSEYYFLNLQERVLIHISHGKF